MRLYSAIGADQVGMAMNRSEEQLHRACADLLRLYEARGLLAFCHVPNGFGHMPAEAGIAKALGERAGVPDLLVWLPGGRSFGVELKAGKRPLSPARQACPPDRVGPSGGGLPVIGRCAGGAGGRRRAGDRDDQRLPKGLLRPAR
jgi:hypothetical protein